MRQAEFRRHRIERAGRARGDVVAIEVPPARAIRHEHDRVPIGRPLRLKDRFRDAACDGPRRTDIAGIVHWREVEPRAVPRHVGMIPGERDQPLAVRREARRTEEVVPAEQDAAGIIPAAEVDGDHRIDRLAVAGVVLTHPDPAVAAPIDHAVGEPPAAPHRNRCQRLWRGPIWLLAIEAPVREVREIDGVVRHQPGSAAVFVHAGAHVVWRWCDIDRRHALAATHHDAAALLLRPAFEPTDVVAVEPHVRQCDHLRDDEVGGDGRFPGTVGGGLDR